MNKKVLGISIGAVALLAIIIGGIVLQKQASERKQIEAVQSELSTIEKEAKKKGELYTSVAALYDEEFDFLAKDTTIKMIEKAEASLSKKQTKINKLEKAYGSKVKASAAEKAVEKLQEQVTLAKDKREIQTEVNALFSSKESAIEGDKVKKELAITADLTEEDITAITETFEDYEELDGKWKEAIDAIIKNAEDQVAQVKKINKLLDEAFDGNLPKETLKQSDYDTLNKEVAKVKNEELKTTYTAKLLLMKAMIDTQAQLDTLTKQQKEAQEAAAKAVEDAGNAAQQAVEDATNAAAQQAAEVTDILAGYSDDQIEFARVWLAKIGTKPSELNVTRIAAGTPINPYNASSATYPTEVIMLGGAYSAEGSVVYASNHNGTVTIYSVPGHWPAAAASDPEVSMEMTQGILANGQVMSVPTGNPNDVRDLILLQR